MSCCTCDDGQYDCAVHRPTHEVIRDILDHLGEIHEAQKEVSDEPAAPHP